MVGILWFVLVVVLMLWLLGWIVVHVGGGLIHILLAIALIILVYNVLSGRRMLWIAPAPSGH